ncbi:MAG: hypothetical protein OEP48_12340 [Betaproteobacteria bacterium]|nr:hypothetical protein [Betaproteobacteria bacterium]MDH3437992.1 hypothetical protein [Betaproteobacteria bacterium]
MQNRHNKAAAVVIYIIVVLIIPAALTLQTVIVPGQLVVTSDNPTPLGYTISLSLFIIPMLAIGWWFFRHPEIRFQKKAFILTVSLLFPLGVILDVLFGNAFFLFQNHNAVLDISLPAVNGSIPIEEFIFYLSGFIVVLLIYAWGDEYWFLRYNIPDYQSESQKLEKILCFHPFSLIIATLLIACSVTYKLWFSGEPGFPWYFIYLTIVALLPSLGFYHCAKHFINWRAFSFTVLIIVLISLLWEVTLALPYQWWGFQHSAMTGIYIQAWHELPIEEIVLWFSVSYATVILYEVIKIWLASNKTIKQAFLGEH